MADTDLRADLEAAFANPDATPAAGMDIPETPAVQPDQTIPDKPAETQATDDRPRNPDGTFAPKPKEDAKPAAPAAQTASPAGATPQATGAPAQPSPAAAPERLAPPDGWKGAGKVAWERLPRAVQQELLADYGRFGNIETQYGAYQRVIGPRAAQLAAEYGSPEKAVEQLFALSDFAAKDPQGFVQWFAQSRGINLGQAAPQAQQPAIDPALAPYVQPLVSQVETLTRKLEAQEQAAQRQVFDSNLETVKAFCADPAHPYVNDVWEDMEALIRTGRVPQGPNALQEAYDRAAWANPTVRAQLIADQREKEAAEQKAKVEQAKRAAVSLNGSPLPGASTTATGPDRSLRDELIANAREGGLFQ